MDRSRTMPRLCFLISTAITLLGTILRTVCMLTCFEASVGYYREGLLNTVCNALYAVAIVAAVIGAGLVPKGTLPTEWRIRGRYLPAVLLGTSLALFTVSAFFFRNGIRTGTLLWFPLILGLLSSTYFFLSASRAGRYPDWLSLLGFLPVIWCVAAIAETYADPYTAMNSPIKIALQMGLLGLMIMVLSELRFRLGKALPRLAVACLSIGSFTCLIAAIPVLVGTALGTLKNILQLLYAVVLLFGGAYGLYIQFRYIFSPPDATDSTMGDETLDPND